MWTQPHPCQVPPPRPSLPEVELLKCGKSVLETIKLVTEVQDLCRVCFSLSVPWLPASPSLWARWCQDVVSVLFRAGCLPICLGCEWLVRTSEGLVLKTSGAELPCLGLKESCLQQFFERRKFELEPLRVISGPARKEESPNMRNRDGSANTSLLS